ncbi:class I SAM-dependent DNA methyltransferase [Streptomyces sp. NPDC091292]|uniref:class I SAM-dependent DNA methyltransferase n=1 Tax=Streptomyces sp. NPDC091292 TaxID=3365991 RepID=UPI0038025E16
MTQFSYLSAVRESYDTVADTYLERVPRPAELDALTRATFAAFAEMVRGGGRGPVADVGCGPGLVTAYLTTLGVSAFGVDVSPRMIALARRAHPGLRFEEGSMTGLDIGDDTLGGVLAWYSIQHTPPEQLPAVFAEFHRTLAPGGHVLIGVYVGDNEHVQPDQHYGHPVSYKFHFLPLDRLTDLLAAAGLVVSARLEQGPDEGKKRAYVCVLARKPAKP